MMRQSCQRWGGAVMLTHRLNLQTGRWGRRNRHQPRHRQISRLSPTNRSSRPVCAPPNTCINASGGRSIRSTWHGNNGSGRANTGIRPTGTTNAGSANGGMDRRRCAESVTADSKQRTRRYRGKRVEAGKGVLRTSVARSDCKAQVSSVGKYTTHHYFLRSANHGADSSY